jgi:hypothetical protein
LADYNLAIHKNGANLDDCVIEYLVIKKNAQNFRKLPLKINNELIDNYQRKIMRSILTSVGSCVSTTTICKQLRVTKADCELAFENLNKLDLGNYKITKTQNRKSVLIFTKLSMEDIKNNVRIIGILQQLNIMIIDYEKCYNSKKDIPQSTTSPASSASSNATCSSKTSKASSTSLFKSQNNSLYRYFPNRNGPEVTSTQKSSKNIRQTNNQTCSYVSEEEENPSSEIIFLEKSKGSSIPNKQKTSRQFNFKKIVPNHSALNSLLDDSESHNNEIFNRDVNLNKNNEVSFQRHQSTPYPTVINETCSENSMNSSNEYLAHDNNNSEKSAMVDDESNESELSTNNEQSTVESVNHNDNINILDEREKGQYENFQDNSTRSTDEQITDDSEVNTPSKNLTKTRNGKIVGYEMKCLEPSRKRKIVDYKSMHSGKLSPGNYAKK